MLLVAITFFGLLLLGMPVGFVLGIAGLLCAISPNWQRATIPLTLASIGVGVTASSLRPVFQRRRGRIGLERAQAYFGPQPVAP